MPTTTEAGHLTDKQPSPNIRERLKGILRPGGYDPGDTVAARITDIDGSHHDAEFEIERYCGGGFAGQVYRARCVQCDDGWLAPGEVFALKFFSPRSGMRRRFRDFLYLLAFQSPFPHQFNEAAVRTGLYLTRLLRWASRVEFGSDAPINDCLGAFWDEHIGSFAEIDEWVEGRVTDPDVDSEILIRRSRNKRISKAMSEGESSVYRERHSERSEESAFSGAHGIGPLLEPNTEIAHKKKFMAALVRLCGELGIDDLARQVYWWTGMSQANVLTRNSGSEQREFVWVDRRPGLPGFLLSIGDFPLLLKAIRRGSIPPFDRINFKKLRMWAKAPDREAWESTVDELKAEDDLYRSQQIDLIGNNVRLLTSKRLRSSIADSIINYWRLAGRVDDKTAGKLRGVRMLPHLLLSCIPLIGARLQKLFGNADYRAHVKRFLVDGRYRWEYYDRRRKVDLSMWLRDGRVSEKRAERVLDSLPAYFRDRVCSFWVIGFPFFVALPKILSLSSWPVWAWLVIYVAAASLVTLPPTWQMFFTDLRHALGTLGRGFGHAAGYVFNVAHRRKVNVDWVHERTKEDIRHGYLSEVESETFRAIAGSDSMQQYVTGIMVTLALQPASEIVLLSLAAVLGAHWLRDVTSFHALWRVLWQQMGHLGWWALPIVALFCAISPAGILRFTYCLVQWLRNRHVPYGTATSLALWRAIGDLAFMVQIARTHPQFSRYLLTSSICRLSGVVPVFGERGGLLNIWAATVFLSWPASFKAWRHERHLRTTNPDYS
ncbi:MAG: hypothetical protein Q7T82_18790 [Armatimonadota bacterium]|nr:hypothetical protein [Armatimonadota bacterium]